MINSYNIIKQIAASMILAGTFACNSLNADEKLLDSPAIHIMVKDDVEIPTSGTFAFDTKIFKVGKSLKSKIFKFDKRICNELSDQLNQKGYSKTTTEAELLINYAVAVDKEITNDDFKYAYESDSSFELPKFVPGTEFKYNQGSLIIDVVDAKRKILLWRGAIMADVKMDVSQEVKDRRLKYAVELLLRHFPKPIHQ